MGEKKISKNNVSISGECYIAHILAKHDFKVSIGLGRTEDFDFNSYQCRLINYY